MRTKQAGAGEEARSSVSVCQCFIQTMGNSRRSSKFASIPKFPGALLLRLFAANGLRTAAIRRGAWGEGDESATTAAISVGENPKSPWRTLVYDTYHPDSVEFVSADIARNSRRP